jgi:ATP-dependent DNA ligase
VTERASVGNTPRVALPLTPPLAPMLAKLERALPDDDRHQFEPKLDGFRALAFRDGDDVVLQSRHGNPLARYFPELVDALRALDTPRMVLDGEIVAEDGPFTALMARLHPAASRVALLAEQAPVRYAAFDLLALGDESLLGQPLAARRERLDAALADPPPRVGRVERGDAADAARWLDDHEGVIAKPLASPYLPGKRGWSKVKRLRTADCVVAGFRWRADRPLPSSLLLGLHDGSGELHHVGVAASFGVRQAAALLAELERVVVPLAGHPWEHGFLLAGGSLGRLRGAAGRWTPDMTMDWTPVAPVLVAEVTYDQVDDGRFRHPSRFVRWRPDRDPRTCTFDQLA